MQFENVVCKMSVILFCPQCVKRNNSNVEQRELPWCQLCHHWQHHKCHQRRHTGKRGLSWCQLCHHWWHHLVAPQVPPEETHWKERVVMMPTLSSLGAPQVPPVKTKLASWQILVWIEARGLLAIVKPITQPLPNGDYLSWPYDHCYP